MTAKAIPFPVEKARKSGRQRQPRPGWRTENGRNVWQPYRLIDLAGRRPEGHPKVVERGPRGAVKLAVGQVWVELHTQELWVVKRFEPQTANRHRVFLARYRYTSDAYWRESSSVMLRATMRIWDDVGRVLGVTMEKFRAAAREHGVDPDRAAVFFGVDGTTGERTHD